MLLAPLAKPSNICSLFSFFMFSLSLTNYLSPSTNTLIPLPIEPVIDSTVLKAPEIVLETRDAVPFSAPFPTYKGPF